MKQHSDYQAMRDQQREREQADILEELRQQDRLKYQPDKLIREMTEEELNELEAYAKLLSMKIDNERQRRKV